MSSNNYNYSPYFQQSTEQDERSRPNPAPVANMMSSSSSRAESNVAHANNVDPPSVGTIWPEAHKWKLATAAVAALTSAPSNAGKPLSVNEIHQALNGNPSYTELCETLEAKGFVVKRGPFARTLLAAVPDLGSSQGQSRNQTSARQLRSPMFASASAPPRPSIKEEMARKRSFNDIVDLTQTLSDEDDFQPSPKILRFERPQAGDSTASTPIATKFPDMAASSTSPNNKLLKNAATNLKSDRSSSANAKGKIDIFKYNYEPTTLSSTLSISSNLEYLRSADVIRSMNRRDALRRSSYNPRTICRDILVSSGKHPTMTSLNSHLEILRRNFDSVDNNSDLSTFKWNLIDSESDSISAFKSIDDDLEMNDADNDEVQLRASPVTRPAIHRRRVTMTTTANGNNVATSNAAVIEPAKGIFSIREGKKRRDRASDTQTRPIDVDASESHPFNINGSFLKKSRRLKDLDLSRQSAGAGASTNYNHLRSDEADQAISIEGTSSIRHSRSSASDKRSFFTPIGNTTRMQPLDAESGSESKRRECPPGSKDKTLRKNAASSIADVSIRTRPESSVVNTTPVRPSVLRQIMTPADGIAVVIESSRKPKDDEKKSESEFKPRKRRKVSPPSRHPSSPNHKVYKCEWKRCHSKLHNLETLRRHVQLHRERYSAEPFPCLWVGCGSSKVFKGQEKGKKSESQTLEFPTEAAWNKHMDGKHLEKYAWELGDGPSTHPSGKPLNSRTSNHP